MSQRNVPLDERIVLIITQYMQSVKYIVWVTFQWQFSQVVFARFYTRKCLCCVSGHYWSGTVRAPLSNGWNKVLISRQQQKITHTKLSPLLGWILSKAVTTIIRTGTQFKIFEGRKSIFLKVETAHHSSTVTIIRLQHQQRPTNKCLKSSL